jgi:hypothetical protein
MQPHENGPWRKEMRERQQRRTARDLRRETTRRLIAEAEEKLSASAKLAREAGAHLHAISHCPTCLFVADGFYGDCGNGHQTVNGEVVCATYHVLKAVWN